jgi:hypothetical protein
MKDFNDGHLDEAYNLLLDGDLEQSAAIFEEKLKEQPDSIRILMELANIYYILGKMAKCIVLPLLGLAGPFSAPKSTRSMRTTADAPNATNLCSFAGLLPWRRLRMKQKR